MTTISIDTEALRAEAGKWRHLSESIQPIKTSADDLWLSGTAFWVGDPIIPRIQARSYQQFWKSMVDALRDAAVEFELVATVLDHIANDYDETDDVLARDFDELYQVTEEEVTRARQAAGVLGDYGSWLPGESDSGLGHDLRAD